MIVSMVSLISGNKFLTKLNVGPSNMPQKGDLLKFAEDDVYEVVGRTIVFKDGHCTEMQIVVDRLNAQGRDDRMP